MGRLSPTLKLESAYGGYYNNRWLKQARGRTEKVPQRDRSNYLVIAVVSSIRKRGEFRVTLGAVRSPHASNLQFNEAAYWINTAAVLQKYCKCPALALQRSCKPTAQILQFVLALTQQAFFKRSAMSALPDITNIVSPDNVPKVKSKVLSRLLPSIELALNAGYTHEQIHAWIESHGLKVDRKYYHDAIYRLRKKRVQHDPSGMIQSLPPAVVNGRGLGEDTGAGTKEPLVARPVKSSDLSVGIDAPPGKAAGTISDGTGLAKFKPTNARNFDVTNI